MITVGRGAARRALLLIVSFVWLSARASRVAAQHGDGFSVRSALARDTALRIVVSLSERRLRVLDGVADTLLVAPVAVGSGRSYSYGATHWSFTTPRGVHTVVTKDSAPLWIPPDWHYVEVARRNGLRLVWLHRDTSIVLSDGAKLIMEHGAVRIEDDSTVEAFASDEHVVADDVLFVPPIGSENRKVPGELGEFRLSIGNGVGIHGTPEKSSVGNAVTHGCMRLHDNDIAWLYHHIPVGTRVYIY